jgi:hypothetical protein
MENREDECFTTKTPPNNTTNNTHHWSMTVKDATHPKRYMSWPTRDQIIVAQYEGVADLLVPGGCGKQQFAFAIGGGNVGSRRMRIRWRKIRWRRIQWMTFLVVLAVCACPVDRSHGHGIVVNAPAFVPQPMQGNGTLVVQATTQHQGTIVGHRDVLNARLVKPPNLMQGQQGEGVPNVHGGPWVVDVARTHDGSLFARGQSFDCVGETSRGV